MLLQATAPTALMARESLDLSLARSEALSKASLSPPPMPGVPTMKVGKAGLPAPVVGSEAKLRRPVGSILNEVGRIDGGLASAQPALWRAELASAKASPDRRAWLRLWLAEADIARQEPQSAIDAIDALLKTGLPAEVRGLARLDRAIAQFYTGQYGKSRLAFEALMRSKEMGFPRQDVSLWIRHARACEGYHKQNERLGIFQPERLDPLCGVSTVSVCMRALGLPHDKETMSRAVRHTGEGSNLQDLFDACRRLGVAAHPLTADEQGLRALPKPLVAHIEHDHFVTVVETDDEGVEYVCSDCGPWPGGPLRVTWKQWRAMRPGLYMAVAKKGSSEDLGLTRALDEKRNAKSEALLRWIVPLSAAQGKLALEASRLASTLTSHVLAYTPTSGGACGEKLESLHCPTGICNVGPSCPMDSPGSGSSYGPTAGDPVNLATGEEEYRPPADLSVYNPTGPSVNWGRIYNSLSRGSSAVGNGWSHPYNVGVRVSSGGAVADFSSTNSNLKQNGASRGLAPQAIVPGTPGGAAGGEVYFENGAKVAFTASGAPTATSPVVDCVVPAGVKIKVQWKYLTSTTDAVEVTFADRSQWVCGAAGRTDEWGPSGFRPIRQLKDRVGNWIGFDYTAYSVPAYRYNNPSYAPSLLRLTRIYDSANATLLSLNHTSDGFLANASDRYGRSVYYDTGIYNVTNPHDQWKEKYRMVNKVSQIVATGTTSAPVRYQYAYTNFGNGFGQGLPYLSGISVPSPTGTGMATSSIAYDATNGFVTSVTDANGNRREYSTADWDGTASAGLTTVKIKNSGGSVVRQYTVGFDSLMNGTVRKNATGQTVSTTTYGSGGATYNGSSVTDGNGRTWTSTFDAFGNLVTSTSPKGIVTTSTYDYANFSMGDLISVKQGAKTAVEFTYYYPSGLLHESVEPIPGQSGTGSVQTTSYSYSALGNVTQATTPGNNAVAARTIYFGYTSDGSYTQPERLNQPLTQTDERGKVTHMRYDARGNMTQIVDALGHQRSASYNLADQMSAESEPPTGNTGTGAAVLTRGFLYVGGPETNTTFYNESGTFVRNATLSLGLEGEVVSQNGPTEAATITYDAAYQAKTVADGNGNTRTQRFNLNGWMTEIQYPGGSKIQYTSYDSLGNLLSRTDARNVVTNYQYNDTDGLLSAISYPASPDMNVAYTYDQFDRMTQVADKSGSRTFAFDDGGNWTSCVTTYVGLPSKTISYTYNPDGSRSGMTTPAGNFSYLYDAAGNSTSQTTPIGTASWTYLDNNLVCRQTLPNGAYTDYTYNASDRLSSLTNRNASATKLSGYASLVYNGSWNLTSMQTDVPNLAPQGGTTTWSYDAKSRLTQESSSRNGGYTSAFTYDPAGNATSFKGATRSYNIDGQRTGTGFAYDANGNPTNRSGVSLTFDAENRATSIGTGLTAGYQHDGVRAWRQTSTGKTYFLYDGADPVVEMDAAGAVTATNVFSQNHGLLGRSSGGGAICYTFDPQGSVAQRLNMAGVVQSSSMYDAYGVESTSGTASDPFGYNAQSGYYLDRTTGFYLCGYRYYDPSEGRFLNRDPIDLAGGFNLYAYCTGNPILQNDPLGYKPNVIGCDDRKQAIEDAFKEACSHMGAIGNSKLKECFEKLCSGNTFTITCEPAGTPGCDGNNAYTACPPGAFTNNIHLCPGAFDGPSNKNRPCLGQTIAHEMVHACGNSGNPAGPKAPADKPGGGGYAEDTANCMFPPKYQPGSPQHPCTGRK